MTHTAAGPSAPLSVVVLTLNEERNIEACLRALAGWADDMFVVDSFSTDETVDLARRLGAHVVQRGFEGFAAQRNWALEHLPFAHEWLLFLDADEWVTEPLKQEIAHCIARPVPAVVGYYIPRRNRFLGRWLRFGGLYPTYLLRLFRRGYVRCEPRLVDEHFVVSGPTGMLRGELVHEDRKGIGAWIDNHNRYAALEAQELLRRRAAPGGLQPRFWGAQAERKRWVRERLWNRLPLYTRPFVLFAYRYVIRLGFLDGRAGLIYHLLESFWYRLLIDLHYAELLAAPSRTHEAVPVVRPERDGSELAGGPRAER